MIEKSMEMYKKYKEVILYLVIGGLTTVINYVVYFAVRCFAKNNMDSAFMTSLIDMINSKNANTAIIEIANVIAWVAAVIFAFYANKYIVFESKGEYANSIREFFLFMGCRVFSLAVEMAGLFIMVNLMNINDLIAKFVLQFIVVVMNYFFSKFLIFIKK